MDIIRLLIFAVVFYNCLSKFIRCHTLNPLFHRCNNKMDLNRVQIFAQVVDKGSFTAAAKAMGITKATVSRKIAELEHNTGVQLLLRTTRSLKLTEAGSIYFNKVNKILTD